LTEKSLGLQQDCKRDLRRYLSNTNPHFKKLYESLVPYRNDAYAWLQVAELDSAQIRMRTRT